MFGTSPVPLQNKETGRDASWAEGIVGLTQKEIRIARADLHQIISEPLCGIKLRVSPFPIVQQDRVKVGIVS